MVNQPGAGVVTCWTRGHDTWSSKAARWYAHCVAKFSSFVDSRTLLVSGELCFLIRGGVRHGTKLVENGSCPQDRINRGKGDDGRGRGAVGSARENATAELRSNARNGSPTSCDSIRKTSMLCYTHTTCFELDNSTLSGVSLVVVGIAPTSARNDARSIDGRICITASKRIPENIKSMKAYHELATR